MNEFLPIIILIVAIVGIILMVKKIKKLAKKKRSTCPECGRVYYWNDDIVMKVGDLQWKRDKDGDTEFYRWVMFACICPKCHKSRSFGKSFNLYNTSSNFSQSHEQEMRELESQIKDYFLPEVFDEKAKR